MFEAYLSWYGPPERFSCASFLVGFCFGALCDVVMVVVRKHLTFLLIVVE